MVFEKRKVTPEKIMKIFKERGTKVTIEQARLVSDYLYKFAELALEKILKS